MKNEPTTEEILKAIKDGVHEAVRESLAGHRETPLVQLFEAIEEGVRFAFADSIANYVDITEAIERGVEKAFKNKVKK